jgi:hypothetical protein
MSQRARLRFGADSECAEPESRRVEVCDLGPDVPARLRSQPGADRLLRAMLRVRVIEPGGPALDELPDMYGRHVLVDGGLQFIPHFPFESGVLYRATFDPRPLGGARPEEVLTLEFSPSRRKDTGRAQVEQVFPSGDSLPENLLRFYVRLSHSMQRGRASDEIMLLGPDGMPASDVLYRPPVELWDRSMRHLTILLDPGRLKRWVGPNRALGPPLKSGLDYTLVIGPGMIDSSGSSLGQSCHKVFRAAEAVREPIAIDQWTIDPPTADTRQPVALGFPRALDWALLWQSITVAPAGGEPIAGRIVIDRCERRWSFTPAAPWAAGSYTLRVAAGLEDVCGNNTLAAFDGPLQSGSTSAPGMAEHSIRFRVA